MFNIAMISRWHPHAKVNRYINQLMDMDDAKFTCVWDEDVARGQKWADELSVEFEANLDELLARDDVDGICVTAPTDKHKEIIIKAAKAGKHVFTEKPLAFDSDEANDIQNVVMQTGIELGVVFPRRANREYLYVKKMIDKGMLGTISLVRIRNAVAVTAKFDEHWFKAEPIGGGGAIRDLGCHNIDLACWLLGRPKSISAMGGFTRGLAVDDTGVMNIKFGNGAIAMIDSCFSAPLCNNWYNLEVYGTKMAFIADFETVVIIHQNGEKEQLKIEDIQKGYPLPLRQWINACTGQGENICDVNAGVLVNKVLDAASESLRNKCEVDI